MSEPTRVIAVRHGETAWNIDTRIQGQLDIALNDQGRWQARRLARVLADESLHAVYSSDLRRAHDTALEIARAAGLAVIDDPGLRERHFGSFEGMTFKEIEERWPEQSMRWRRRDANFAAPGGETLADFYQRATAAAARIATAHPGGAIALVTHGGVLDCLYRAASRIGLQGPRTWQLGNANVNRLLYTGSGFSLVGWSDNSHLEDMLGEGAA